MQERDAAFFAEDSTPLAAIIGGAVAGVVVVIVVAAVTALLLVRLRQRRRASAAEAKGKHDGLDASSEPSETDVSVQKETHAVRWDVAGTPVVRPTVPRLLS